MNYSKAVFLINNKARAINCIYEGKREDEQRYTFKTLDPSIKKDDLVIVPTDTRIGMTVVKVVETDVDIDLDDSIQLKWIVGVVNKAAYDDLLAQEQTAIATIKSAEFRKKRTELREAVFKDQAATLQTLQLTSLNGDNAKASS